MPKFFVDEVGNPNNLHHLKNVLRLRAGDKVTLCDGASVDYFCVVESVQPFSLKIESQQASQTEPTCKITLYQSMLKSDKMDWVIQKAVELGVHAIVPILTEHSVAKNAKAERYNKIAESAAGQSMRGIIPKVHPLTNFEEAISNNSGLAIAAHEKETECKIKHIIIGRNSSQNDKNLSIWIGPEGGFSEKETAKMREANFHLVSLGSRILRAETAALAALTQILMLTED